MRGRVPVCVLLAGTALTFAALPGIGRAQQDGGMDDDQAQRRPRETSQEFFARRLLADDATAPRVKALLRRGGFVNPQVRFKDLTKDRRADAVVRVASGGSAGDVALYVFSTDGARDGDLRVVYRKQALYRVSVALRQRLYYRVPRYAPGEELCCPATLLERSIRWDARRSRFVESGSREIPGPGAAG